MSRTGKELVNFFSRVGCCDPSGSLSGEDLDWIFETSGVATLEFLEWVCENLHEENVLSEAEIQEWEDLKRRSPESILSGSRLQEAIEVLKNHDLDASLQLKEEAKEQNIALVKEELNVVETSVQNVIQVNRSINATQSKLGLQQGKFDERKVEVKRELSLKQRRLIKINEELKMCIDQLSRRINETELLTFGQQSTLFLTESDLTPVVQESEKISDVIKTFLQARQMPSDVGSKSSWKGTRDMKEFEDLMKEIDRLRFSIADCEKSLICEEAELTSLKAGCQELERQTYQIKQGKFTTDLDLLNSTCDKLENSLSEFIRKSSTLCEETLAPLIDKKVALLCKDVLAADLEDKISRQESVVMEMDVVIDVLLKLTSVQEVLGGLLQQEVQRLENLRGCMEEISNTQKAVQDNHQECLDEFEHAKKLKVKNSRKTLHPDDAVALAIKKCVVSNDIESGILTTGDIIQSVQALKEQGEVTESKLNTKYQIVESERKKISSLINEIQSELQMKSSSFGMLTAPEVSAKTQQFSADIRYFESSVKDVVEAWEKAKRSITDHPSITTERSIWKDYFVQPEVLERTIQKVTNRPK